MSISPRTTILSSAFLALFVVTGGAQTTAQAGCRAPAPAVAAGQPTITPIEISNNHVYVKICAGDAPLDFILDTGAGDTFFDLNHAKQVGLKVGSEFAIRGIGAGTVAGARIEAGAITLAGTSVKQPVSLAIDLSKLPAREGHRMDGILGYDFIRRYVVGIDYVKQELRLYDPDAFQYAGSGSSIPVTFFSNHPNINAEVRLADGTKIPGRMIVDVGATSGLSLTKSFVDQNRLRDRVGPTVRRQAAGGVGGMTTSDIGRVAGFRIGNIELSNPIATLYGDSAGVFSSPEPWVANIGGDILRRFTVFLDYKHNRIILEPHAGTTEPFEADMSGIAFVMDDNLQTLMVDNVVANSPAGAAGLAPHDTVTAIDGRPATSVELRELKKRFKHVGERVTLTIRRAGQTKDVVIVTRRLI